MRVLALQLRRQPQYAGQLDDTAIELIFKSAPLHDIGKVGIPDAILLKPGPLNAVETARMHEHPVIGRDAILMAERLLGARCRSCATRARSPIRTTSAGTASATRKGWLARPSCCRPG